MRLRPMRWWDVAELQPLERQLFADTAWSAEVFWSELAHPGTRWYVVADRAGAGRPGTAGGSPAGGQGPLGYAGLVHGGAEADVQTVAVAPHAQGRGVGGVLVRALVSEAARRGASSLLLEVRADNAAAIALYHRHGFVRIAVRRGYYQPAGVDAWVMRLRPLRDAGTTLPG